MIYFLGEKEPRQCKEGDITLSADNQYVKIDHIVDNGTGCAYHPLDKHETAELIKGLFMRIVRLEQYVTPVVSRHTLLR